MKISNLEKIGYYKVKDICEYSIEELKWDIYKKISKVLSGIYGRPKRLFRRMVNKKVNSKILVINNENIGIVNYSKFINFYDIGGLEMLDRGFIHRSSKFLFKGYEGKGYGYLLEKIFFEEIKDKNIDGVRFSITPDKSGKSLGFVEKLGAKKVYESYDHKRGLFEHYMIYDFYNKLQEKKYRILINDDLLDNNILLGGRQKFKNIKIGDILILNNKKEVKVRNIKYFANKSKNVDFAIENILNVYTRLGKEFIKKFNLKEKNIRKGIILLEVEVI